VLPVKISSSLTPSGLPPHEIHLIENCPINAVKKI
jgi:hypothetical protein